jgi:lipoate---protein ligase
VTRGWVVEQHDGAAGEFHARAMPDHPARSVWWFTVDRPAIVLGSSQPATSLDLAAVERHGIDVVQRRSGGGAVLLMPGEALWADIIVPAGDSLWSDDVGRAAWPIGEAWASALATCGFAGGRVHQGALVSTRWSALVCFAGLGPGEVRLGEAKAVGISQRRTRAVARFQCALHRRWRPALTAELFAEPRPSPADLAPLATEVDVAPDALLAALVGALTTIGTAEEDSSDRRRRRL